MKLMRLDEAQLRDYLALYGADIDSWPKNAQSMGHLAQHHPEFAAIIEEEERFEKRLLDRLYETPMSGLAERIIAASHARAQLPAAHDLVSATHPAALAAMLVLGFAIGFGTISIASLTEQSITQARADNAAMSIQSFSDDEGATL